MEQSAYPRSAEQWFQLIREKWDEILTYIRTEFDDIPVVSYNIWISGLKPGSLKKTRDGGYLLSILVPDENNVAAGQNQPALPGKVYRDVLNRKYSAHISVAVCEVTGITQEIPGTAFTLEFTERAPKTAEKENVLINKKPSAVNPDTLASANLNPRYTFDTFVVGKNNNMAHAYALGVAENPGILYNPLFLYGGVGLGKTHLMQSIAHFVLQSNPKAHVLYVTSESFTNELIDAIRAYKNENIAEFRNKYRNIDILLIDDIQFITNKDRTQEEFFHTFNDLYANNKQIIISSDKPPRDLAPMEDRLISRFESGLTVDIQPPDYETRVAILRKKEELDGINIDNEIIQYIAANIKSNIRELEGALNNVVAGSKLGNREITLAMAQEVLRDRIDPNAKREITPDLILRVVADHFGVSVQDLMGQKRNKEIVYPRQLAMYLCRDLTQTPLQQIGQILGGRDHTTVIHGLDKISTELKLKPELEHTVSVLRKKISIQ